MPSIVTQLFLLLALLHLTTSLPVGDEEEVESFLNQIGHLNAPWSPSRMSSADAPLEARLRKIKIGDVRFPDSSRGTGSVFSFDNKGPHKGRQLLLSEGLDRRRQLGDIEFSNRYAEFLRSKAKHGSVCAFLRRMQSVRKSGVGGDLEKVNLLLKQYMCPSVYNNWSGGL